MLEPRQSGVQLFVVRGETREAIDRRPFSAPERIAFADTEGVELELVAPAVAWPKTSFTLEVVSAPNATAQAAIDATSMQAIASTIPATAEGLRMAA